MRLETLPREMELTLGNLLRLEGARGLEICCDSGHLWITEEAQPDDVWLGPGQRVYLVGDGVALVEAKQDARLRLRAPVRAAA